MRTEDDLRNVFAGIAASVADADPMPPIALVDPALRRRPVVLVLVAATLVALVAGIAFVSLRTQPSVVGFSPRPWAFTITVPSGWQLDERDLGLGGLETAELSQGPDEESRQRCTVTSGPGPDAPLALVDESATSLNGRPARLGRGVPSGSTAVDDDRLHVRWAVTPDRWADATCWQDRYPSAGSATIALAERVRLSDVGVVVPVSFAHLPHGLQVSEVRIAYDVYPRDRAPRVIVLLAQPEDGGGSGPAATPTGSDEQLSVAVSVLASDEVTRRIERLKASRRLPDRDGRPVWLNVRTETLPSGRRASSQLVVLDGAYTLQLSVVAPASTAVDVLDAILMAEPLGVVQGWYPSTSALGR